MTGDTRSESGVSLTLVGIWWWGFLEVDDGYLRWSPILGFGGCCLDLGEGWVSAGVSSGSD